MSKKKVSLSTCGLQKDLGDIETLKFVKSIGADGVDFCLYTDNYDVRNPESIYSKSDDEIKRKLITMLLFKIISQLSLFFSEPS